MMDKGAALNKKVWKLFENAGFRTKPNSQDPSEEEVYLAPKQKRTVDLLAEIPDLKVKIIGWNKAVKNLRRSLSTDINDYKELMRVAKANTVLFVTSETEVSEENKEYARQNGMTVWGSREIDYYSALVGTQKGFAKYEIMNALGIETEEQKDVHHVLALRFHQPLEDSATDLFVFPINPERLLKTCAIFRKAQGSASAYQRMLRRDRVQSVLKFIRKDDAILPTNIIVNLGENVSWDEIPIPERDVAGKPVVLSRESLCDPVVLKIPLKYASLELIDGQHRLYGFLEADLATRQTFTLAVVGIAQLPFEKRRDTFVAINDNSRRMDPNLVAFLKYTENEPTCQKDPELMAIKVTVELNKEDPFKDRIRLLDVGGQKITLKGFSGYDLRGLVGKRGLLQKYYRNDSMEFVAALRLYFGIVRKLFKEQWKHPDKYIIFQNRGMSAFLKLLRSLLRTCDAKLSPEAVEKYLKPLREEWSDSDLETETLAETLHSTFVGSTGWRDLHKLFVKVIKKQYQEFKE